MKKQLLPILSALLVLSGCGGGGGGGSAAPTTNPPSAPDPVPNPASLSRQAQEKQLQNIMRAPAESGEPLSKAPDTKPRRGSVVQSTNTDTGNNDITKDSINIDITGTMLNPVYSIEYHADPETDSSAEDTIVIDTAVANDNEYFFNAREGHRYRELIIGGNDGIPFDANGSNTDDGRVYATVYSNYDEKNDTDYIAGGVWLYIPNDPSTRDTVFGAFADGNAPFADIGSVTGQAQYTGDVIGLYSVKHSDDSLSLHNLYAGVELTAQFGESPAIRGAFTNIVTYDGELEKRTGSITLQQASIDARAEGGFFTGQLRGTVDEFDFTGHWVGQFYGEGGDQPARVIGTAAGGTDSTSGREINFIAAYAAEKQ